MLLLLTFGLLWSCSKESSRQIECELLASGLIQKDLEILSSTINGLSEDLLPRSSLHDPLGQNQNLRLLIQRLNGPCQNIKAELRCYGCIYTQPARSEILITLHSAGTEVERVIDITTPEDAGLAFGGVH
jgi:hypothetical protein